MGKQNQPIGNNEKPAACAMKGLYLHSSSETFSNIHRQKSCWAGLSKDTRPALQGTINISRGEEIYIPAHMKNPFSLPTTISTCYSMWKSQSTTLLVLDKDIMMKKKVGKKTPKYFKKKNSTTVIVKQNPLLSLPVAISFSCSLW